MINIQAAYTGELEKHTDGVDYAVLDTTKLDFNAPEATFGKKTKPTLVRVAKPGEEIVTKPGKVEESRTVATGGEIIFINELPGGVIDAFIPRDTSGVSNGAQTLEDKYELVGGDINGEGAYFRPKGNPSKLLHEAIEKPTCIKDAWGPGNHQFLGSGATLKQDGAKATGIDKSSFDETWGMTDAAGRIQTPEPKAFASRG